MNLRLKNYFTVNVKFSLIHFLVFKQVDDRPTHSIIYNKLKQKVVTYQIVKKKNIFS